MRCAKVDRHNLLYRMGRVLTNALPSPRPPKKGCGGGQKENVSQKVGLVI